MSSLTRTWTGMQPPSMIQDQRGRHSSTFTSRHFRRKYRDCKTTMSRATRPMCQLRFSLYFHRWSVRDTKEKEMQTR